MTDVTPQIQAIGQTIVNDALSKLGDLKPPQPVLDLLTRAAANIAACTVQAVGATGDKLSSLQWQIKAEVQAIENLGTAEAVVARAALIASVQEIIPQALSTAATITATAFGGPIAGNLVQLLGNALIKH